MAIRYLMFLVLVLVPQMAHATVYWASATGSNTANCNSIDSAGTADSPGADPGSYGTIARAANCANTAGDVVNIKAGTYTGANNKINTTSGSGNCGTSCLKSGTSDSVLTYLQGDPGGAKPQINIANWLTIYNNAQSSERSYLVIRNISSDGSGGSDGGGGEIFLSGHHITVTNNEIVGGYNMGIASFRNSSWPTNNHHWTISNNKIHGIGGGGGYTGDGNGYCVYANADDVTIERNQCYDVKGGGIHLYDDTAGRRSDRAVVRYNYIYNIFNSTQGTVLNQCFGVVVDGIADQVYNNVIQGSSCSAGASKSGIQQGYESGAYALMYNNIILNWKGYGIEYGLFATSGTNEIKNNIILGNTTGTYANTSNNGSQATVATNKTTGALTDCTPGSTTYTQKSGSSCIDAGTAITGHAYNGSAPDIGAFEAFVFSTCSVANATASVINATFTNNAFPPLLPSTGVTTFTARKAGANNVVTGVVRTGDNQLDITVTNAFVAGNAIDISWASGNLTDSANIGGSSWAALVQPYVQGLTNQSCTNNVGGAPSHLFIQAKFEFHGLRGTEAAPVVMPYSTAPEDTNINVVVGGKARLRIALTCTTADCPPTGFYPFYACASCTTAGTYTLIPDTFAADEDIALCGTTVDPDIPTTGTSTTDQLSTAGTFVAGAVVRTSNAIPTIDLAQNEKTELEYCIAWDTDAVADRVYTFRVYKQDSTAIDTYTVTPQATVRSMSAGMGF